MTTINITDDMIRLGQFLKMADLAETGGEAKQIVQQGRVKVNGEVETRRGRQLHAGDVVELDGRVLEINTGAPD